MSTAKTTAELSHPFILALMAILVAGGAALLGYGVGHQQGMTLVVLVVQDNLVKGAAGQAVQNMNLMFGLNESAGLDVVPMLP